MGAHRAATAHTTRRAGVVAGLVGLGILGAAAPAFAGEVTTAPGEGTSVVNNNENTVTVDQDDDELVDVRLDALEGSQDVQDAALAELREDVDRATSENTRQDGVLEDILDGVV